MSKATRIGKLRRKMAEQSLGAVLVTSRQHVQYLSGFTGTDGDLFLTLDSAYLITDFRYLTQAKEQCPEFIVKDISQGLSAVYTELIQTHSVRSLGFEDREVTYAVYKGMKSKFPYCTLVPIGDLISSLRIIKDPEELESMEKAAHIGDLAFTDILDVIRPGISEREVAAQLEYSMKKNGASGPSFETIVASGYRSSMPHGTSTDKPIESGDLVVLDFGCIYDGYCSDMTRTVAVGSVTPEQKQLYNIVLYNQLKCLKQVKNGAVCKDIDAYSRRVFSSFQMEQYFGHGLGHGVGVEIHELPNLNRRCTTTLCPGMVVTVEPGLYVNEQNGVRIEDSVVVTALEPKILTHSTKELLIL